MANNVHSYIEFVEINDAAKAKLVEMFGKCTEMEYGRRWFGHMFTNEELSPEDTEKYEWTTDVIGPKWCYIEDSDVTTDTETPYMVMDSAWAPPSTGLQNLLEVLAELDPNMITSITYEDEMPNFVGWEVYVGSEMEDCCEDDYDEIKDRIFEEHPNLKEHWSESDEDWMTDEETGDYTEEAETAQDEFRDILYESISDWNSEGVADCIRFITENREEA